MWGREIEKEDMQQEQGGKKLKRKGRKLIKELKNRTGLKVKDG